MKLFSPGSGCALLVLLLSVLSCCSLMQALLPQVREQGPPTTLNGSELAARVVRAATEMGKHLSGNPDTQYHPERFPQNVLTYWNQVCPVSSDCYSLWQPGRLQCVFLVTGAYAAAGAPLPAAPNASDFWEVYAHFPGWQRIPVGKGLPAPGDILVWRGGTYGHVAIVREITRPTASHPGKLTFIQANGPRAFDEHSLLPSLHPVTWPGFEVLGYLRPIAQLEQDLPDSPYVELARQAAHQAGLRGQQISWFLRQINQESGYNPMALSPAGAAGIAQLMPETATRLHVDPWDPEEALSGAARLMKKYVDTYHGDFAKALAAYNAGPGATDHAIATFGADWLAHLPTETQHYVQRILRNEYEA